MSKVIYYEVSQLPEAIKNLNEKKKYKLVPQRIRRSLDQNALLHVYFQILSDRYNELGEEMTPDILKEVLKIQFGIKFERKGVEYPKPTHLYDTKEMKQFIDNLQVFSKKYLDFELPNPNDKRLLDFYNDNY